MRKIYTNNMYDNKSEKRFKAKLQIYKGMPTILVNDKPVPGLAVLFRNDPTGTKRFRYELPSLRKINPDIVMLYANVELSYKKYSQAIESWVAQTFSLYPKSLGALHIGIYPDREWTEQYPQEMTVYDAPIDRTKSKWYDVSWASEQWRKDSSVFIEKLITHLHKKFYGRLIIYQTGSGMCAENFPIINPYTAYQTGSWFCGDFSEPMLKYFRNKLKIYYNGDVKKLRKAWSNSKVTFESALPPTRIERTTTEWFSFRSPKRNQTADFYGAWSEAVEDCVLIWAQAVKKATKNESLTASPLGSILDCGLNTSMLHHQMKGMFSRALTSPYLDMLQSPASYVLRDLGDGNCSAMIPLGTLKLAGKIWLRDFDTRTSLTARKESPVAKLWRSPKTTWEDSQILKRDIAYSLLNGGAIWFHEIEANMYSLPTHIKTVKRLNTVGKTLVYTNRMSQPGLAVFVDIESNFHLSNSNRLIYAMNYYARQLHWSHCGMASEVYLIDDALNPDIPDHKVIMVTNAFCLTEKQHIGLIRLARKNRATIIWLMAPGIYTPKNFDIKRVSEITGFTIRSVDIEGHPSISLVQSEHPLSRPFLTDGSILTNFGAGQLEADDAGACNIGPMFYVDVSKDSSAVVLGNLDILFKPGLVVKQMKGYTSVYCSVPYIHNALLRAIGKYSHAHIYLDTDDMIYASKNLILINAKTAGEKTIYLPRRVKVALDIYTGNKIAHNCHRFVMRMKKYETRFIFVGSYTIADKIKNSKR